MQAVRGGARRKQVSPQEARRLARELEAKESAAPKPSVREEDDGARVVERRRRRRVDTELEAVELPTRIQVKDIDALHMIPRHVLHGRGFKWDPQAFVIESERLKDKLVESDVQDNSLRRWLDDPSLPMVYGVTGAPDDVQGRYFAAYLAMIHAQKVPNSRIVWHSLYGGYRNELLDDYKDVASNYEPTLLVLTNLAAGSTPQKLEKARDLIERFSSIPRIVVAAGEDPLSFLSVRLNAPCNGLAYFPSDIMRRKVEVI